MSLAEVTEPPPYEGSAALKTMKALAGTWEGTHIMQRKEIPAKIEYKVSSNGSTVVETMFVDPEDFTIRHGDARATLYRQPPASFDVIVTDAFHDIAIPYHLVTLEYARLAKSKLKPGGLFTTNVVDVFPDPRMVKSLVNTLRQAFAEVDVWLDRIPEQPQRMTYVISASEQAIGRDVLESRDGLRRAWLRINEPLENTGTALSDLPVFSDDFVPVERMISSLLLTPEGK